jgi:two-component system chemotaxis response regulator CheB
MPPTFTVILAAHIARVSGRICAEAQHGEPILAGQVYVAPGGHHMLVSTAGGRPIIEIDDGPPENFCKPAVDPMLRSAVEVYRGAIVTAILTGMGSDGLKGCGAVVEAGGTVIAQDEASSIVWGMPGAVAGAGLCSAVVPATEVAARIAGICRQRP